MIPAHPPPSPSRDWAAMAAALLAIAAFPLWLRAYVPAQAWLPALALPLALLAAWRPAWALTLLLAAWPCADRTLASGSVFATESDLLVLAVAAGGGVTALRARALSPPQGLRASALAVLGFAALVLCFGLGVWRAWQIGPQWVDGLALAGYSSPHNALRIAKGLLWALLLAPLAQRAVADAKDTGARFDWLFRGMLAGLALACAAAILERLRFTGLSDFSSDYRITAPFWEMHVGGAALDGYLALAMPFALSWALLERRPLRVACGALVSLLAAYVAFVTFSRGVYAALAVALLVFSLARFGATPRRLVLAIGFAGAALAVLAEVFALAGYRGLGAALILAGLVAALPLAGPRPRAAQAWASAALALCLLGAAALPALLLPKAAYFAFAALALLAGLTLGLAMRRTGTGLAMLAQAAVSALAPAAVGVAWHWGGAAAAWVMAPVAAVIVLPAWLREHAGLPAWRPFGPAVRAVLVLLVLAAGASVALGQHYMAGRFGTSVQDLDGRFVHWRSIAALLRTPSDWAFGLGTGRLPEAYFWAAPGNQFPGGFALRTEASGEALHLIAPRHPLGWGDMLRVGQQLPRSARAPFVLSLEYRAAVPSQLHAEVCRRQLIYANLCAVRAIGLAPSTQWQALRVVLPVGALGGQAAYAPPLFFALALGQPGSVAEFRRVSLLDASGNSLLRNGELRADGRGGLAHWFFTSDRLHLAWHAKNLWLALVFDVGLVGATLFSLLLLAGLARLSLGRAGNQPLATVLVAALAGFAVVGMFDSLVDVPRVFALAMWLLWLALGLRRPPWQSAAPSPAYALGASAAAETSTRQS